MAFSRIVAASVTALVLIAVPEARAERARYRYVPTGEPGNLTLQPAGGERLSLLGTRRQPDENPPKATHVLTFVHPATGQRVSVPVALPAGTPQIEYRYRRAIYNYGSYTVEVVFLPDGSVEVVYNSGLFRAL